MGFRQQLRRLLRPANSHARSQPRQNSKASRNLFLESLEPRHLMAGLSEDSGDENLFPTFTGNYFPAQHSKAADTSFLSPSASGDALAVALNYLQQNGSTYGVTAADLSRAGVTNRYVDSPSGISHIYLQQSYNGLPILDATANVNLMPDGRVITAAANFVPNLTYPATNTTLSPTITSTAAINAIVAGAGLPSGTSLTTTSPPTGRNQKTTFVDAAISSDPIPVQLVYVPSSSGGVDLAWEAIVHVPSGEHWFDVAVGASGSRAGQVVRVMDWVDHFTSSTATGSSGTATTAVGSSSSTSSFTTAAIIGPPAFYNVFPKDVQDPLYGSRSIVTALEDPVASPYGWHDLNFIPGVETTTTRGNNVDAAPGPTTGFGAPNGGVTLNFNFPFNINGAPAANIDAATTNLFFWVNSAHDVSYRHGFDEASGNFQFVNRSTAGIGNDDVDAQSQFIGPLALNNAFMATPPDGQSPLLAMGLFSLTTPFRDSDFDGTIISHEYAHGISNRLTGGPANANALNALQSGGMGEGWSDWFALIQSMKLGDTASTPRTTGQWVLNQPLNGPGVRRFPYSFDKSIDPLTLGDFNGDLFPQQNNSEVHNAGEIWASALWDMTWLLVNKHGFNLDYTTQTGGQNIAMNLVFQAMKLQPTNPSFLQARNAIISADLALNAGANYELIWQAFARRGFGVTAVDPNSSSLVVFEAFDEPPPLGHVIGTVFNDTNGNLKRDASEGALPNITVYNDANDNGVLDTGETSALTQPDGTYNIAFVSPQLAIIRQSLSSSYKQVLPQGNAARRVFVSQSQTIVGQDFGDQGAPGKISGTKFNDLNANGVRDTGEPGISKVFIYVDVNNDSKMSITEPAAVTDNFGNYTINNLPPGNNYIVREILPPGGNQIVPGPTALPNPYAHSGVTVIAGQTTTGIDFANTTSQDFGDAPDIYGTTLAANGPRSGILPGFRLGLLEDPEVDGLPTVDASAHTDDDGVVFVGGGITPGVTGTVQVTVNAGSNSPGRLQGWVDFNQNGKFDASERVIANQLLGTGVYTLSFPVPATAGLGSTFARFRYGYESDLAPTGFSIAGEVEDYQVTVLPSVPIAKDDEFPLPGDPIIKQGTIDNVLDVLANDIPTLFGPPTIVAGSFPASLPSGSTLHLNATGDRILYSPAADVIGQETFTYQVTDGHSISAPGTVTINVSLKDPIALDNTYTLTASNISSLSGTLAVMANDQFPLPLGDTHIVSVAPVTASPQTSVTINSLDNTLLDFSAPIGFHGTEVYQYTIDDSDPATIPATAFVTLQVVDNGRSATAAQLRAAGYLADLSINLLTMLGLPLSNVINVGDQFQVQVTSEDLRLPVAGENRGVDSVYLDLLFDRTFLASVSPIQITFDPQYNSGQSAQANKPASGQVNEAGAFTDSPPVGAGVQTVFTIVFEAIASTPGGQSTRVIGDPTDVNEVDLTAPVGGSPPVILTTEQVFLRPSSDLIILGAGEGEFVNRSNPFDVNQDTSVSPVDALLVINSINSTGSRSLRSGWSLSGTPQVMLDVNMDSMLSPGDALSVINYLNTMTASSASQPSGEGEGEGEAASGATSYSLAADDLFAMLALTSDFDPILGGSKRK